MEHEIGQGASTAPHVSSSRPIAKPALPGGKHDDRGYSVMYKNISGSKSGSVNYQERKKKQWLGRHSPSLKPSPHSSALVLLVLTRAACASSESSTLNCCLGGRDTCHAYEQGNEQIRSRTHVNGCNICSKIAARGTKHVGQGQAASSHCRSHQSKNALRTQGAKVVGTTK